MIAKYPVPGELYLDGHLPALLEPGPSQPAITRASALSLVRPYASAASESAFKAAIVDPDPLVRSAALRVLPIASPRAIIQAAAALLSDPVRVVRVEAARALAGTDLLALTPEQQTAFVKATAELVTAEMVDADRAEAHLNLGLLDLRRRELPEAEGEFRAALRLDPNFVPALGAPARIRRRHGSVAACPNARAGLQIRKLLLDLEKRQAH